ncbi:pyridoxamine 5'-phosphate oxidase family protein [Microbacterium sp.]|uniref:pyridoxamine 5'-phosphate oxidase family protein n=1 Tax=Microbacterium sp. TaxID=51671 RepID=UPI002810C25C|nr:pyridoxamine 5'-phosphate oxidase family protein [Microbacterium sp.]
MIGIIDEDECFALLRTTTVGRVGFVNRGRIEIIPVNYRLHGRELLLRTRSDGVLAGLPEEPDVAFEVDHHDDLAGAAWNVLLSGHVEAMSREQVEALPAAERVHPWAGGERTLWLRYVPDRVSGRRVRRPQTG